MPDNAEQYAGLVEAWRRDEVQALGAALSMRSWHHMEQAYNRLRDKMDRYLLDATLNQGELYR